MRLFSNKNKFLENSRKNLLKSLKNIDDIGSEDKKHAIESFISGRIGKEYVLNYIETEKRDITTLLHSILEIHKQKNKINEIIHSYDNCEEIKSLIEILFQFVNILANYSVVLESELDAIKNNDTERLNRIYRVDDLPTINRLKDTLNRLINLPKLLKSKINVFKTVGEIIVLRRNPPLQRIIALTLGVILLVSSVNVNTAQGTAVRDRKQATHQITENGKIWEEAKSTAIDLAKNNEGICLVTISLNTIDVHSNEEKQNGRKKVSRERTYSNTVFEEFLVIPGDTPYVIPLISMRGWNGEIVKLEDGGAHRLTNMLKKFTHLDPASKYPTYDKFPNNVITDKDAAEKFGRELGIKHKLAVWGVAKVEGEKNLEKTKQRALDNAALNFAKTLETHITAYTIDKNHTSTKTTPSSEQVIFTNNFFDISFHINKLKILKNATENTNVIFLYREGSETVYCILYVN